MIVYKSSQYNVKKDGTQKYKVFVNGKRTIIASFLQLQKAIDYITKREGVN